jgi:hypothetical protein
MNWQLWLAIAVQRFIAMWAWSAATELRKSMRRPAGTLAIAMLAWIWPVGVLIVVAVQIALALQKESK